jgi:uncharacterized membrane protein
MATGTKRQKQGAQGQGESLESAPRPSQTDGGQGGTFARSGQDGSSLEQDGQRRGEQGGLLSMNEEQLARGLGWFSLGLGLAEVLSPRGVAKVAGLEGRNTDLIRLFGLREIASGVAILMRKRPAAAVWSRVAGDALDLACLGASFASPRSSKGRLAFATANVLAVTALDVICAQQLSSSDVTTGGAIRVSKSIVVNRSPEELYQFWHDFENLPRFMKHLESVRETGAGRSHWKAKAPAGSTVEWDAEITDDRPGELIAWRSLEGADVYNTGSVRFERAPGGRGTRVSVEIDYTPPGGVVGAAFAKLFGEEPAQQVGDDLRRFKQVIETGEVIVSDGTVFDNGLLTQRPAQPTE